MNKQIQKLAEEAGIHDDVCSMCPIHELEKFAELIVRECAEMVRIQNEQFMENESHYGVVSTDILKHFGIKE